MFNIQKEQLNEISKIIWTNINITKTLNKKLKEMEMKYLKLDTIINILSRYFNEFFRNYLWWVSKFISSIKYTYEYFYKKIFIDKSSVKDNIEDFVDFIYYVSNFDYLENQNSLIEVINYFEDYFSSNKLKEEKWKDEDNNTFEILGNKFYQNGWNGNKLYVDEYKNYCLQLIIKKKLQRFPYVNQKYLWFLKFKINNILWKNKEIFLKFFQNILMKEEIKNLMIKIFPILNDKYFINENFVSEFFNKVRPYNFKPKGMCRETISYTLDVYIKSYFNNNSYESEICAIAYYILVILHEFAQYLKIFIYKTTGNTIYRKSFDLCKHKDIGDYFENLLFGKIVQHINLLQAIYILDENNYNKKYNQFAEEFLKWGNENVSKIIKDRFKEIIPLLKNLNIKSSTSKMEMNNETFNI